MIEFIFKVLLKYGYDTNLSDVCNLAYCINDQINEHKSNKFLFSFSKGKEIIAFTGTIGSGKSTCQTIVSEMYDGNCELLNFGDVLKKLCVKVFPNYPLKSFYGNQNEKEEKHFCYNNNLSGRTIMQMIGTDIIRNIDEDYWVDCMRRDIWYSPKKYIIIGDVRFNNEAKFITDLGGKIIFLKYLSNCEPHISENGIDKKYISNVIIREKDSLETMKNKIHEILKAVQ